MTTTSYPKVLFWTTWVFLQTFDHVHALWVAAGEVICHINGVRGRPCRLHFLDLDYLKRLIKHWPDWFLDELQYMLQTNWFMAAHFATIHQELVQAGISSKKIKVASERNEQLQADFIGRMAQYSPEQLRFLDEVSKDKWTSFCACGHSHKGTRAIQKGVFVWGCRFSAKGLLTIDGMVSNTMVEGSMVWATYLEYLEFSVIHYSISTSFILKGLYVCRFHCALPFPGNWVSLLWITHIFIMGQAY